MIDYFCFPSFITSFLKVKRNRLFYEDCIKNKDFEQLSYVLFDLMIQFFDVAVYLRDKKFEQPLSDETCPSRHMRLIIENSLRNNRCILYDANNCTFVDVSNSPVSITNCRLYFFSYIFLFPFMTREIYKKGGIPIISTEDELRTLNWFNYFPVDRKMMSTSYGDFVVNTDKFLKVMGRDNKLFVKTVSKDISGIYTHDKHGGSFVPSDGIGDLKFKDKRTRLIISTPLEVVRDEYDTREWRTFVMNGVLQNISRQTYGEVLPVEPYVVEYIKKQVKLANLRMPINSYVMDFMEYSSENGDPQLAVTEFNAIAYADVYNANTAFSVLKKSIF